jgi:hypothetical protein
MRITANLSKGKLVFDATTFAISCDVRSLRNKRRESYDVVRSIPSNLPYDPMPFPKGVWKITGVEWQREHQFNFDTYGPVKIRTDAAQWVKVWELDKDGDYLRVRGDEVMDCGYLLHYSLSRTTWGCIRIESAGAAENLGKLIERVLKSGEKVELEVV